MQRETEQEIVVQIEEGLAALENALMLVETIPGDVAYQEARAALEVMGHAMRYAKGVNDELRRQRNHLLTEVEEAEFAAEVAFEDAMQYVDDMIAGNIREALVALSGLRYDENGLDELADTLAAGGTEITPEQVEILRAIIFNQEWE